MDSNVVVKRLEDFPCLSTFATKVEYMALQIPSSRTTEFRTRLRPYLFRRPKIPQVYPCRKDERYRVLVLSERKDSDAGLDPNVQKVLQEENEITLTSQEIELSSYSLSSTEEILRQLLGNEVKEIPTSFEIVGSIAHVNLRDDCLPFKFWIGKVILDKNSPRIRTVVNKLGTISSQYRTFDMEVIAGYQGDNWSVVNVKEQKCTFQLDFKLVYWNSRLSTEHHRLVQVIGADAAKIPNNNNKLIVADVMAGVGPFAIPLAASPNIVVHANDLNPHSYHYLQINAKKNKVAHNILCYQEDGRDFIRKMLRQEPAVSHFILNLPASAPEFLDAFLSPQQPPQDSRTSNPPWIHVYCFAGKNALPTNSKTMDDVEENGHDTLRQALDRCGRALNCQLPPDEVRSWVVRNVSPKKDMLCLSFQLPREISSGALDSNQVREVEPPSKRCKLGLTQN